MHTRDTSPWLSGHVFAQDEQTAGEKRTFVVVVITTLMMVLEITAGAAYGSMALLADGLHMASHAAALGITLVAYAVARRLAGDPRFSFGTGKINSLAGFTGAVLLLGFALLMVTESIGRLLDPVPISYEQALLVAVVGFTVNGVSAWLLATTPHGHGTDLSAQSTPNHEHDHNLRAAYLHVLADTVTSITAIVALVAAKYYGLDWLDPVMGMVGAALVGRWSWGLLRDSALVLLDRQVDEQGVRTLTASIERDATDRVVDLHCWSIGHGIYAAEMVVVSDSPKTADYYRSLLPSRFGIVHTTIEIHRCPDHPPPSTQVGHVDGEVACGNY